MQQKLWILPLKSQNTSLETDKILVTSTFSFSHNISNSFSSILTKDQFCPQNGRKHGGKRLKTGYQHLVISLNVLSCFLLQGIDNSDCILKVKALYLTRNFWPVQIEGTSKWKIKCNWKNWYLLWEWLKTFLAPLVEGQRALIMVLCLACVRPSVRRSVNSSFKKLLRNYWLDFYQISQECSLGGPFSNSFK